MDTPYAKSGETYLLLADNLSTITAGFIDAVLLSGSDLVVITSNKAFEQEAREAMGISCFYTPITTKNDNKSFFYNNMPGSLEELKIESFPLWKGLAIDRLRFWQLELSLLREVVENTSYTKVVIQMNPHSPLSAIFDDFDTDNLIVLKDETLRTPEILNFLKQKSVECVITDSEIDTAFIANYAKSAMVWRIEQKYSPPDDRKKVEQLIYYDKQYIWQFNEFAEKYGEVQAVSHDERSRETFLLCHPKAKSKVVPPNLLGAPTELILFAYDEKVIAALDPEVVTIFDPYGVNMAKELSVGDERVRFVD